MAARIAEATWEGTLNEGTGSMKVGSGAFDGPFTFKSRFDEGQQAMTNPEELLGAAHAGCFTMALGARLGRAGFNVKRIHTTAHVHLEKGESGFSVSKIDLVTEGEVEGLDQAAFAENAEEAKKTCIVSRALSAVPMTVQATLK
ncbi:MAG: OsmC family peroxiredoxin [bacterium]|nr:OsmC family peroxiredoxin [bacterium]